MNKDVLVIEDNRVTAENIRLILAHNRLTCDLAHSGLEGLQLFQDGRYQLILLNPVLPDLDGYSVCRRIRDRSGVPVIMLSARISDKDLVTGFESGADDYLKKPYSNKELIARIKAQLRRYRSADIPKIVGPYTLDTPSQSVSIQGRLLKLTQTEYLILVLLLTSPGKVFSREDLFIRVFDTTSESADRTIDVHLHNLRKKLRRSELKKHGITSVYGVGYKLVI